MRAVPEVKDTINLATQYMTLGYDPKAFMDMLGQIVCHDNFTEMHAFRHHNAVVEEYYATRAVSLDAPCVRCPGGGGVVRRSSRLRWLHTRR
jgi:hypothetical protein